MGKAKKAIPRRRNPGEADENRRRLTRTLTTSEAAELKAEWEKAEKARSRLDRVIAIEMGLIPPPSKPATSTTKQESEPKKLGWQERRLKPILCEFWPPDGKPPANL